MRSLKPNPWVQGQWKRKTERQTGCSRRFEFPVRLGLMLLAIGFLAAPVLLGQIVSPEVRKVSERFVCQCGCSQQLSVCSMLNCGSATPLRAEVADLLKQGKTEEQIVNIFTEKYGKVILSAPTARGFDLTAWTLPFVMLLLGLIVVYALIKAWARRQTVAEAGRVGSIPIPDSYQKQIEKELKELDT
jgi:cytochrome c-type biogenesis protein CcmH